MIETSFSIKYDTGKKPFDGLDHYYGAESLLGISQALLISLNAFLNNEILVQATAAKGFRIVLGKAKEGSWEQQLLLRVTSQDVAIRLNNLGKNALNDLLKWSLNSGVGKNPGLNHRKSSRIARELERQNDDLHENLEGAIRRAHAPVKNQGLSITISSGRTAIATFDEATLQHIYTEIVENKPVTIKCAVSRFNTRTGTGRFISTMDSSSIPFSPEGGAMTKGEGIRMADNLAQLSRGNFTPMDIIATRVTSKDKTLKRYIFLAIA
jgi:hypothetical protein